MKSKVPLLRVSSHTIWTQILWMIIALVSESNLHCLHAQNIRYVKPVAVGNGDGTSWDNASGDLQAMLQATGVEQVWVAGGIYKPGGSSNLDRTVSFSIASGTQVYGGFVGTEVTLAERPLTQPSSTTLSGDIGLVGSKVDNSLHVVIIDFTATEQTQLDGFVITAGYADGGSPSSGDPTNVGAGLSTAGRPTIVNCSFVANISLVIGGGIAAYGNSITLLNCSFSRDSAYSAYGGGIYVEHGTATIINCSFSNNYATLEGGAIFTFNGYLSIANCNFLGNSSQKGGALGSISGGASAANCIFWHNGAHKTLAGQFTLSYCLVEPSVTTSVFYLNGGHNRTIIDSPFRSDTDFQLNACSPAINAGNNTVTSLELDGLGNNRIVGGIIDIGAFEFQGIPLKMYTVNPGSWNDPAIWSCGRLPLLSDAIQINHLVTIPANYQAQAFQISNNTDQQLVLGSGSTIKFGN